MDIRTKANMLHLLMRREFLRADNLMPEVSSRRSMDSVAYTWFEAIEVSKQGNVCEESSEAESEVEHTKTGVAEGSSQYTPKNKRHMINKKQIEFLFLW